MCESGHSSSPFHPSTKAPLPHSWEEAKSSNLPRPPHHTGETPSLYTSVRAVLSPCVSLPAQGYPFCITPGTINLRTQSV